MPGWARKEMKAKGVRPPLRNPRRGRLRGYPRAAGGPVMPNVAYRVGERGPETVTFGAPGYVTPNGGGGTITVPVYLDGKEIARVIAPHLQRRGKRNSFQTRGRHGGNPLVALG